MSEKYYNKTQYRKNRQIATAFAAGIYAGTGRAYCGFQSLRGGFAESVPGTVFGIRPKGV